MEWNVIVAGDENDYTHRLTAVLEREGHHICSRGSKADMLIFCIDPAPCEGDDYEKLAWNYEKSAMGLVQTVGKCIPLLKDGKGKRLCFLTTLRSSINGTRAADHWERVIAASCNMAIRTFFNRYAREGYTFRVFGVEDFTEDSAGDAVEYFLCGRSLEPESDLHSDEKRLVLRDRFEREYPW